MPIRQNDAYAGIGSRETPDHILATMQVLGKEFAELGLTLRSGGASGADLAFEVGANQVPNAQKEIYLPWKGFNQNPSPLFTIPDGALEIAKAHHPAWHACSHAARKLHARNVLQILGQNLDAPVKFVVCWTPDGAETRTTSKTGGTGQAIRIANIYQVPVFNLNNDEMRFEELMYFAHEVLPMQYTDYFG